MYIFNIDKKLYSGWENLFFFFFGGRILQVKIKLDMSSTHKSRKILLSEVCCFCRHTNPKCFKKSSTDNIIQA